MKLVTVTTAILAFTSLGGIGTHGEIQPIHSPLTGIALALFFTALTVVSYTIETRREKRKRAARRKSRSSSSTANSK